MKLTKCIIVFLTLFYCISASSESFKKKKKKSTEVVFNYIAEFNAVDSLINLTDQPKSAGERLKIIKQHALSDNQNGYYIKCIKYEVLLKQTEREEDDTSDVSWQLLCSEIASGTNDIKAFLSIDAAAYLKNIYQENRWQSNLNDDKSANPEKWSTQKLNSEINRLIDDGIKFAEPLSNLPIYEPLIQHFADRDFQSNIHQILIQNAISLLDDLEVPYNADYKMPDVHDVLAPLNLFLSKNFATTDDPKNEYKVLILYQRYLSAFLKTDSNALICFDIARLKNLKYHYADNDVYYLKALDYLQETFGNRPYSNLVAGALADFYQQSESAKSIAIINEAIKKFPGFLNENALLNTKRNIERPEIGMQLEKVNQPGRKLLARVDYKNLHDVFITVYKIDYVDYLERTAYHYQATTLTTVQYADSLPVYSKMGRMHLPPYKDYKSHSAEIGLDSLSTGTYLLIASNGENIHDSGIRSSYGIVSVAPYTILENETELYLIDAMTGLPYANEPYNVYTNNYRTNKYEKSITGITGNSGLIDLKSLKKNNSYYSVTIAVGKFILYDTKSVYNYTGENESEGIDFTVFKTITDRSIYRPGQTVYFKCIAYDSKNKVTLTGKKIDIVLKDNNREDLGKLTLTTNQYGSVNGHFDLPKSGFNTGEFYIYCNNKYVMDFRVEEYKRPKYQAKFLTPEKAFSLNDEILLTGEAKAFAGYAIQDARVEYSVTRRQKPVYDWWYYRKSYGSNSESVTVKSGKTITDKAGKFTIDFIAIPDESISNTSNPYYVFEISATITDLNGEISTCDYSLDLAYTDRQLYITANEESWLGQPITLRYSCNNLQEKALPFTGNITIEKIVESNSVKRARLWPLSDTMSMSEADFENWFPSYVSPFKKTEAKKVLTRAFSNELKTEVVLLPSELIEAGNYRATMNCKDNRGVELKAVCMFKVIAKKAGDYNLPDAITLKCLTNQAFMPGDKVAIIISSGAKNAKVYLTIKSYSGTVLDKEIQLNQSSQIIDFPVTAKDRGNMEVKAVMVSDYRLYTTSTIIKVPYSNKELKLKLSSFRNETEPGAKEKWVVKLEGPASEKVAMETVASMYDESLDRIYTNADWHLSVFQNYSRYSSIVSSFTMTQFNPWENETYWNQYEGYYEFKTPCYLTEIQKTSGRFKPLRCPDFGAEGYSGSGVGAGMAIRKNSTATFAVADNIGFKDEEKNIIHASSGPATGIVIRKNFNETAFFYPNLYANAKGEISLEFTMPEALTQWKLRMLSHSKTLQSGYLEQSITTSKKVMIQPNVPRFLRQGDRLTISSKIINTTSKAILATVSFKLTDEATGLPISWLAEKNDKTIAVPANSNAPVTFSLNIPDYTGIVTIQFSASAGLFSDGEQHTLPVLSNRSLITESMPITVRKSGTQTLEFSGLKNNKSSSLVNEKFSIEMCSNPSWYAIQALPYLMEFPHECAEQVFTRLYANSIAGQLAKSHLEIKKVVTAWELQASRGDGLQSKLQKNEDLKSTMIQETPWLYEARNETERMQKLGRLFNDHLMNEEMKTAFEKLGQMQLENGAFGWFKGMEANNYITQTIVIGFGKMKRMGVDISVYQHMIDKAINFLDETATKNYQYYHSLKNFTNFYPSELQYLYCKSYFPDKGLQSGDSIVQYFLNNAASTWTDNGLLNRAQLAVAIKILQPDSKVPTLIIQSFKENSKHTVEMGMYWPDNKSGYYWHEAPIETQSAIIEAFSFLNDKSGAIMEQQIWLLRQKQTGNWGSTRATADACYALLTDGRFAVNKQIISVAIDNVLLIPEKKEEGTGYFRVNMPKESIGKTNGTIEVKAATNDFAYGAAYWQYFEQMNKVNATTAGLSINKKIYRIENSQNGKVKTEIVNQDLKVGDMIEISLNIVCDRNMEFIHIKDLRGSGTEPLDILSEYHWQNGLGYYQSTKDAATHFFIDYMAKGVYQLSYVLKVEQAGVYNSGIAVVECMYAPEFNATGSGLLLHVKE